MKVDNKKNSINKRYISKLIAAPFSLGLALLLSSIVPRALGPERYGDFGFLQSSFATLLGIITAGSAQAFFTFNSKEKDSYPIVLIYSIFIFIVSALVLLIIALASKLGLVHLIWPGQTIIYIYMASIFSILFWVVEIYQGFMDSKGLTIINEKIKILIKIFSVVLIFYLFVFNKLNLKSFYIYQYLTLLAFIIALSIIIYSKNALSKSELSNKSIKKITNYFINFCRPLFFYGLFGFLVSFFYRWLLQFSSGSAEQGNFTFATQLSSVVLIFTAYFIPIFMREISLYSSLKQNNKVKRLVIKSGKILLSITVFLSIYFVFHAEILIELLVGSKFSNAYLPVSLMLAYPIFQTIGQLNATVFYSLNKTSLYSKIGYFNNFIGLIITYILIAPSTFIIPGFSLGSFGLAISTLSLSILSTNILTFFSYNLINLSFKNFIVHEIVVISFYIINILLSKVVALFLFNILNLENNILLAILTFIVYLIITLILNYRFSWLIGINKSELREFFKKIRVTI